MDLGGGDHAARATAARMNSIAAAVEAPGVNTSATPMAFSAGMSSAGICHQA